VREHDEPTVADLGGERFEQMRAEVLDTDTRIPYGRRRGGLQLLARRAGSSSPRAVTISDTKSGSSG
jgi:hypothetical protein